MAFPRDYLHDGERLVLALRPHWWTFAGPGSLAVGAVAVAVGAAWTGLSFLVWLGVVLVVVAAGNLILVYGRWITTHFVLTSDRLIFRTGVLTKTGIEIPLTRINNVNSRRSLFERVIGAGDLLIESAGESGQSRFSDVRKPDAVQNEIYRQIDQQRRGGPAAAPPSTTDAAVSAARQIEELDELRRKGLVSDEEFEAKRRELLDRM